MILPAQAHHMGLVVNPEDFPHGTHIRRAHPEMEDGKKRPGLGI